MSESAVENPVVIDEAPAPEIAAPISEKVKSVDNLPAEPQAPIPTAIPHQSSNRVRAPPVFPNDNEVNSAKSFLQSFSERSGLNLYDHLSSVLGKVLEQKPSNAVDVFESISAEIKRIKFKAENPNSANALHAAKANTEAISLAKANVKLYESITPEDPVEAIAKSAEEGVGELPDIMDLANMWEWAGLSFGREETFTLFVSIRNLVEAKKLKSIRLWGKIIGTEKDYIIAEAELAEGSPELDEIAAEETAAAEPAATEGEAVKEEKVIPDAFTPEEIPKSKFKTTPALPKEASAGVNKYVYYVCHYPGAPWVRLPDVLPEQIQAARQIVKYFTGDLKRKIVSYPAFKGTEAHYLRAQIARISASTVLSPTGYYMFDQDEGADDEEITPNKPVVINAEFEGVPNAQLLDINNWVHHMPYVLPQGRVTWENPWANANKDDENKDDEEKDEDEDNASDVGAGGSEQVEPESGPALLSPAAADEQFEGQASWATRICSRLSPIKYSPVCLRSTRWPGAHVIAHGDKFCNIYMGYGLKDLGANPVFYPPVLGEVQKEFGTENAHGDVNEITEAVDPTVEEEKALEEALKEKEEAEKDGEEGDEEEEDA